MARTRSRSGGRGGVRTLALVVAVLVALGSTAAVVLSDDPQTLRLAVVGALWAFVLAAFAAPRRREPDAGTGPGTDIELRRTYEIELEREVAARREYELQLEVYLRRELERGLAEDVAALRDEVGRMRGEMIDRLDGELRMERIETTRLIGGSLRALQDEARRLGIGMAVPSELSSGSIFDESPPAASPYPASYEHGGSPAASVTSYASYADLGPDPLGDPPPATPVARAHAPQPESGYPPAHAPRPESGYPPAHAPQPESGYPPAHAPRPESGYPPAHAPRPESGYPPAHASPPEPAYARPPEPAPPPNSEYATPPAPRQPPAPRPPPAGESVPSRRRRAREDGEDNEVMSRLLGR
jgi:hypothetical protein